MSEILVFSVSRKGVVTADAQNFSGTSCTVAVKAILDRLPAKVESDTLKPEYFQSEALGTKDTNSGW